MDKKIIFLFLDDKGI